MQATELYAIGGALAYGVLAVLHAIVWRAQRERASLYFAVSYFLAALFSSLAEFLQPVADRPNVMAIGLVVAGSVLTTFGLVNYMGLPGRVASLVRRVSVGFAVTLVVLVALRWLPQLVTFSAFTAFMLSWSLMAGWAMRNEPRQGHGLVFLVLLACPLVPAVVSLGHLDKSLLRYVLIVPMSVAGMTLLTTGLLRAQRRAGDELNRRLQAEAALHALNESLEQRVTQRTAELREVMAGLESFNRSVSHDLQGPLGGIAGVARLAADALDRGENATVRRMLPMIGAQADASARLVGDLLALARAGDIDLAPQRVDLETFVRDTIEQMRLTDPRGVSLPVTTVSALPTVQADPGLLRQVYVNLLGNALKFSREASPPQIEVGAYAEGDQQVLFVRDNGVGFDPEQAERMFAPFQRLHGQRYQGHGVGLSIVKRIVERHGGRLWAQARPNAGATFYFSLSSD